MTDLELIAIFAGSWIVAAAVWMLVDWAARPKHSRFSAKADRVKRGPLENRHFRMVRRAEENEETRLLLTERTGKPTLALRAKRRDRVEARHDAPVGQDADGSTVDEQFWIDLRDSSFDDANAARLAAGNPPIRYNPITDTDEEMIRTEADTAAWPGAPVDPFAGNEVVATTTADEQSDDRDNESNTSETGETVETDATDQTSETGEGDQVTERVVRDLKTLPEAG